MKNGSILKNKAKNLLQGLCNNEEAKLRNCKKQIAKLRELQSKLEDFKSRKALDL